MESIMKGVDQMENLTVNSVEPWAVRHNRAVLAALYAPTPIPETFPGAVITMIAGWQAYAENHQKRYDSPIGADGVLGDHWKAIGDGLLGLLNGETGNLDCGTLDKFLRETMRNHGVDPEA